MLQFLKVFLCFYPLKKFLVNKGVDSEREAIVQDKLKRSYGRIVIGPFEIVNKYRSVYQYHLTCST